MRLLFALMSAASSAAAVSKPIPVSIEQLLAAPAHYNGKRVEVTGFFEAIPEAGPELRATAHRPRHISGPFTHSIWLDFSEAQQVSLANQHFLKGRVHVVGRFDYSQPHRDIEDPHINYPKGSDIGTQRVWVWQGFGLGYTCQITKISNFSRI